MSNTKERRKELIDYIKSMLRIYYNKKSELYKDRGLRYMINKAKLEVQIKDFKIASEDFFENLSSDIEGADSEREEI